MTRTYNDVSARIRETIVEHMPKDAEITRIEFEGPRLAIYVKNINLLSEQNYVVTEIVNLLHKRIPQMFLSGGERSPTQSFRFLGKGSLISGN